LTSRCQFGAAAKNCKDAGDDLGYRVYSLLAAVALFCANYDAEGNPYGAYFTSPTGQRSLIAEDLSDADLDALAGIVNEISDSDFRARVADILWECRRDHKMAEVAVHAFLKAADAVKTDELWPPYVERLERAANLAARIGFGKPLHEQVLRVVDSGIKEFEDNQKAGLRCERLMRISFAHKASDAERYANLSEKLAKKFAEAGNWDFSQTYWESAQAWYGRGKETEQAHRCGLAAAECLVSKAEAGLADKKLGAPFAAHWMGAGVEALRQARADSKRINDIHRRFLDLQQEALGALNPMELKVDEIPGFRENEAKVRTAAVAHVSGYAFERAVVRLAHIAKPTDVEQLREQIRKQSEEFIWSKIVETEALDHTGKIADKIPPSGFGPDDIEDDALRKRMVLQSNEFGWQLPVAWRIEPARLAILKEHPIRRRDLFFLVAYNPFIAPGHEGIYVRGLQAGFFGDWLVAAHILIPQIEASIRHVFQQHGIVTSTLESDETQKERDLNQLLWMPEMEKIFGPDITFDLRGILIERFGANMRNESAHGLMPESAFYQPTVVYLWWLVLRLCVTAHVQTRIVTQAASSAESTSAHNTRGNDAASG